MKPTVDQIIEKYGIENPSSLAEAGCSAEEYNACVGRNKERVRRMTDEEYQIYIQPRNEQIADDVAEAEEAELRDAAPAKELIRNHDQRRIDESPKG